MPLIIITGHPSSGKTYRARQLQLQFETRIASNSSTATTNTNARHKIILIPSHHSTLDPDSPKDVTYTPPDQPSNPRDLLYNLASAEKTARAEEFSAIKRALNKNDIVIADGLNYIKGFRYQLWCEAKAAGTRCIVVHVAAREDECEQWNRARLEAWGWAALDQEKEEDVGDGEHMKVGGVNVRVGRNVMGALEPESHTALYGDRVVGFGTVENDDTRSRSSSMGAVASDEEEYMSKYKTSRPGTGREGNGMTLKSLYISDQMPEPSNSEDISSNGQGIDSQLELQQQAQNLHDMNLEVSSSPPPANSSLGYSTATLKSLLMRYEPPSPFTRWDTPLFTIPSSDSHPPYDQIWSAIFPEPVKSTSKKASSQQQSNNLRRTEAETVTGAKNPKDSQSITSQQPYKEAMSTAAAPAAPAIKPHAATILPTATQSEALQILESATSEVVKLLLSTSREDESISNGEGGSLNLSFPSPVNNIATTTTTTEELHRGCTYTINIPPNMTLSQPVLQRLRRKYTQIQRGSIAHGRGYASAAGREAVIEGFLDFLQAEFDSR